MVVISIAVRAVAATTSHPSHHENPRSLPGLTRPHRFAAPRRGLRRRRLRRHVGGVIAAVQAKQMGKTVVIVCPDKHLGGLSSGGLGFTDTGNKAVIGGLSREFYHRVWKNYDSPRPGSGRSKRSTATRGRARRRSTASNRTMWIFEPHVAEQVFEDFVKEYDIPVVPRRMARSREGREEGRRADRLASRRSAARPTPARCSSTPPTKAT